MAQMTLRSTAVFLFCAALFVMTLAWNRSDAPAIASASVAQSSEPAQWEYQTMAAKSPEALVAQANQGGTKSWELVSTVHVLNTNRYEWVGFFKRLKR